VRSAQKSLEVPERRKKAKFIAVERGKGSSGKYKADPGGMH